MVPDQQAREARHMHEQAAKDELNMLSNVGPDKVLRGRSIAGDSSRDGGKIGKLNIMALNESKGLNRSSLLEAPVPHFIRCSVDDNSGEPHEIHDIASIRASHSQHQVAKSSQLDDGDHDPTHSQATNNLIEPVSKASSTSTDHPEIPSKRALPASDDGTLPFEIKKISLTTEQLTAEQPTLFPNLLRSLPTPSYPIEHPTQLSTLQTGKITYTGAANPNNPSIKSNEFAPSKNNALAQTGNHQPAPKAEKLIHNSKAYKPSTIESDATEDEEMKSTASLKVDGDDDSDTILQDEEEVHATSNTAPIVAQGSSTNIPITRDTSFSTRPSRKAARKASAIMAAARKKNKKKKGKAGGGGNGDPNAAPPFVASGAPPPPPPPPPRRSAGRGGPPSGGHNVTWGFTTGPNGPWIEPPVINDPIFARPSEKKGLKKETQEAIKQLERTASGYDPHSPGRVAKQERMYKLRLLANTGQWATSNVRGATDWEEVQKQRMGVAVREAMRKQEEEDEAEEMERMREEMAKHRTDKNEKKKKDNGEGSSKSAAGQVMQTKRSGGGEGSATTMGGSDGDDDAATLIGEQSHDDDDDDDRSVHDAGIPRSFNEDFAQRIAALRQPQSANNRAQVSTHSAYNGNRAPGYTHPYSSDKAVPYPFPFHKHVQSGNASKHGGPSRQNAPGAPTAPFRALPTPPASFLQQNYAPAPTYASSPAALREIASSMTDEMNDIASRDNANNRTTGDGGPVRMHDFQYDNLVNSGQIGGAADTREVRPAPGPFVFQGAGASEATMPSQRQESDDHNARMTDLMERHLGLQLESPPPAGEAFPALTGEWPQFPAGLMGHSGPSEGSRGYEGAGARQGSGPFGEGSSGSGQHQSSSRPE